MGNLLSYSGITTKLRAMQSKLLTDDDFRELSEITSVPLAVAYLKQKPSYIEILSSLDDHDLHRGQIEKLLMNSVYKDFERIYRFANQEQRIFLNLYFKRFEILIIKNCINNILDHRGIDMDISLFKAFFDHHSKLNVGLLSDSSSTDELIDNLKGSEYYKPLSQMTNIEHPTLFDYEMALDLYYFGLLWKTKDKFLSKIDLALVTNSFGSQIDLLNLQWIYRSRKFYKMSAPAIYALTIPVTYKLKKSDISALVEAEDDDSFRGALAKTYYGLQYDSLGPDTLERMYSFILRKILKREASQNPYSVATIYRYLHAKEHEIQRITIALECIRYGLEPHDALDYILKY